MVYDASQVKNLILKESEKLVQLTASHSELKSSTGKFKEQSNEEITKFSKELVLLRNDTNTVVKNIQSFVGDTKECKDNINNILK